LDQVDDVGFLLNVTIALNEKYPMLNPNATFVSGVSNGGMMTNRFACEFKSRLEQMQPTPDIQLVAVAAVSGPLVNGTENTDEQIFSCDNVKMPILHIHGNADPIVPFGGCNSTWSSYKENCPTLHAIATFAPFPNVDDYISDWRMRNGVHESPERVTYQNNSVRCSSWGSDPLQNVTLCVATGEGHAWPGNKKFCEIGMFKCTLDMDASAEIIRFFKDTMVSAAAAAAAGAGGAARG
jgi:polyhydroxybutyrate depolymerase